MKNTYLLFIVLFLVNNVLHQVSEKVVIILFILLIYILYTSFRGLVVSSYSQRLIILLRESHLYIDSLFLLTYLTLYLTLRTSYALNEANTHLISIHNRLFNFNNLTNLIRTHLNKTSVLLSSILIAPNYNIYLWLNEYSWICLFIFSAFLISSALIFLSYVLVYQEPDIEKNSAYECGFQPFGDTRSKFNVKYYLIAILFMIFDLEIMYLFP